MLEIGREIERYTIEGVLGRGGMATVYRVRHGVLGTPHALKVLTVPSRQVRRRLVEEGRLQATLRHPNIVSVTDVIDVEGAPGLLMELIEGPTLKQWFHRYDPSLAEALAVFRGVCAGVGHAHAHDLVHRDLKPGNILLQIEDDRMVPKVSDFGLAKVLDSPAAAHEYRTKSGATMGTPGYMSPEQIRDASRVDRRSDIYALGCILYQLVCGVAPYGIVDDLLDLYNRIAEGRYLPPEVVNPEVPDPVARCIHAMLHTDPAQRAADTASVLEVLDGVSLDPETVGTPLGEPLPAARKPQTEHPSFLTAADAGFAAAGQIRDSADTPDEAERSGQDTWRGSMGHGWTSSESISRSSSHPSEGSKERQIRPLLIGGLGGGAAVLALGVLVLQPWRSVAPDPVVLPEVPAETVAPDVPPDRPAVPEAPQPDVIEDRAPALPRPPPPEPAPPEPAAQATFVFEGADAVWLERDGQRFDVGSELAEGVYKIKAVFAGGAPAGAGQVTVVGDEALTLVCDPVFAQCRSR